MADGDPEGVAAGPVGITDAQLRPANNDLTLVRLLLASLVIYSHAFYAVSGSDWDDLAWLLGAPISNYAVDGFFTLSGFLVYRSIVNNGSIRFFILSRLARLWPGLIAMLVVVVLAGAAVSSLPLGAYLAGRETLKFLGLNATLLYSSFTLSGVQCGAQPCNVNGSLWTLPWEAHCYTILAVLALIGLSAPRRMTRIILPATLVFAIGWDVIAPALDHGSVPQGLVYLLTRLDRLWVGFALGIACYLYRHRIRLSWAICLALLLGNVAVQRFVPEAGLHARQLFTAYFVLCLGFRGLGRGSISSHWPDYSYGMYIYAFPVMMALQQGLRFASPYPLALANFLCTVPLAALSWHLVEKPVLDRLKKVRKRFTGTAQRAAPLSAEPTAPGAG